MKLGRCVRQTPQARVAPRTGAWIETQIVHSLRGKYLVAPRTGAWIET